MAALNGQPGELRFVVEIKRAATGKTEVVELIGKIGDAHGGNSLDGGKECCNGRCNCTDRGIGETEVSP